MPWFSISCGHLSIYFNIIQSKNHKKQVVAWLQEKLLGLGPPEATWPCGLSVVPSGQCRPFRYAPHQNLGNQCQRPSESLNDQPQSIHIPMYETHQNYVFNFERSKIFSASRTKALAFTIYDSSHLRLLQIKQTRIYIRIYKYVQKSDSSFSYHR